MRKKRSRNLRRGVCLPPPSWRNVVWPCGPGGGKHTHLRFSPARLEILKIFLFNKSEAGLHGSRLQ